MWPLGGIHGLKPFLDGHYSTGNAKWYIIQWSNSALIPWWNLQLWSLVFLQICLVYLHVLSSMLAREQRKAFESSPDSVDINTNKMFSSENASVSNTIVKEIHAKTQENHIWLKSLTINLHFNMIKMGSSYVGYYAVIAVCKLLAISLSVLSGFRGGFIFPLFLVGTSLGQMLTGFHIPWLSSLPPVLLAMCFASGRLLQLSSYILSLDTRIVPRIWNWLCFESREMLSKVLRSEFNNKTESRTDRVLWSPRWLQIYDVLGQDTAINRSTMCHTNYKTSFLRWNIRSMSCFISSNHDIRLS